MNTQMSFEIDTSWMLLNESDEKWTRRKYRNNSINLVMQRQIKPRAWISTLKVWKYSILIFMLNKSLLETITLSAGTNCSNIGWAIVSDSFQNDEIFHGSHKVVTAKPLQSFFI